MASLVVSSANVIHLSHGRPALFRLASGRTSSIATAPSNMFRSFGNATFGLSRQKTSFGLKVPSLRNFTSYTCAYEQKVETGTLTSPSDRARQLSEKVLPRIPRPDVKKVLVVGSGGLSIGQAGEFDYSGERQMPLSVYLAFVPPYTRELPR